MTNEITLQLWVLLIIGGGILIVSLLVFVSILAELNRKWRKEYVSLHNELKLAILSENANLRNKIKDEEEFKEYLKQDLNKAIKILKVRVKPVDNELTQLWIGNKNIPVLNERFNAYKEWIYKDVVDNEMTTELEAKLGQE